MPAPTPWDRAAVAPAVRDARPRPEQRVVINELLLRHLACVPPRTIELPADQPDHRLELGVDRGTGLIALLVESFGGRVTRRVEATQLTPNGRIPDAAFALAIREGAATIH